MAGRAARRRGDPAGKDYAAMRGDGTISWKIAATVAFGILVTAGGGWMSYVQSQINTVVAGATEDRKESTKAAVEGAKTQQKVDNVEKKVDQVERKLDKVGDKLEEILKNQERQIYQAPPGGGQRR